MALEHLKTEIIYKELELEKEKHKLLTTLMSAGENEQKIAEEAKSLDESITEIKRAISLA